MDGACGRQEDEALKLMRAAADLEDGSEKHVAMENRLWPMRELLGELLLDVNRPAEALRAFELSFKAAPNRFRGFYGAARAAERLGDRARRDATTRSSSRSRATLTAIDLN